MDGTSRCTLDRARHEPRMSTTKEEGELLEIFRNLKNASLLKHDRTIKRKSVEKLG